jgi:hypothetical protein
MTKWSRLGGVSLAVLVFVAGCGGTTPNGRAPSGSPSPDPSVSVAGSVPPAADPTTVPASISVAGTSPAPAPPAPGAGSPATSTDRASQSRTTAPASSSRVASRTVPNVLGMPYPEAKAQLDGAGVKSFALCGGGPSSDPNGVVYFQTPSGGSPASPNTSVEVSVAWIAPINPSQPPGPSSGPIPQKPCPY